MSETNADLKTFAYRARTAEGMPVSGTIQDAADHRDAMESLESMRLLVAELEAADRPARAKPLAGDDFLSFNQQLAHLTQAGLPVERGLRLIAQETRSKAMAETIRQIAAEAERGKPLGEAFGTHRGKFPPLYGRLIDAGIKANNLPGMLFNLGRHLELIHRLRAAIWRTVAYPLVVLAMLAFVLIFLSVFVIPQFGRIYDDFNTRLPTLTVMLFRMAHVLPAVLVIIVVAIFSGPLIWRALQLWGVDQFVGDAFCLPLPLIGPVLRRNLIARWCDAVRMSVEAGLDLPAAIRLAGESIGSPSLLADGEQLIDSLSKSGLMAGTVRLRLLTETVGATIDLASDGRNLAASLDTLSQMYQKQAEYRLGVLNVIMAPILIVSLGLLLGFVILALFLPLVSLVTCLVG